MKDFISIQNIYVLEAFFTHQHDNLSNIIDDYHFRTTNSPLKNECRPNSSAFMERQVIIEKALQIPNYNIKETDTLTIGGTVFKVGIYTPEEQDDIFEIKVYKYLVSEDGIIYTSFHQLLCRDDLQKQLLHYLSWQKYHSLEEDAKDYNFTLDIIRRNVFKSIRTLDSHIKIDESFLTIYEDRYKETESKSVYPVVKLQEVTLAYENKDNHKGWDVDGYPITFDKCIDMDFYWFYNMYVLNEGRPS